MMKELCFRMEHVQQKCREVIFIKFCDPRCDHCSNHPVISQKAWEYLPEHDFKWPSLIPSIDHLSHYITFIETSPLDKEFFLIGKSILLSYIFFNLKPFVFLFKAELK